jgi:hypothetical protein
MGEMGGYFKQCADKIVIGFDIRQIAKIIKQGGI